MWDKITNSRVFYAVIAVICSFAIWLYIDISQSPNYTTTLRNIPVTFAGEDVLAEQGLMITDGSDATVTLTISGPRSAVSQIKRSNTQIVVQAAQQISGEGTYELVYTESFPSTVSSTNIRITGRSVSTIAVTVVQHTSKVLELAGKFTGTTADGVMIDENEFQFENPTVTISGERSLIDQVTHAYVYLQETDLSESYKGILPITLEDDAGNVIDIAGLSADITEVYTIFPIQTVKEVPLAVTIIPGGGATEDDIIYEINPKTVTLSGNEEVLAEIESINLGSIDLDQVITSDVLTFDIQLPDGVTNISGTGSAAVTISVSNLTTLTAETSDIQLINLSDKLSAELVTQSLVVRIRGDADIMSNVLDSDIYVEVDMSDITDAGTRTLPATIRVRGFSDVGAIGTYQVVIEVSYAESELSALSE